MKKIIPIIVALLTLAFVFAACGNNNADKTDSGDGIPEKTTAAGVGENKEDINVSQDNLPIVTITMEDGSEIKIELYPDVAPNTVNNFISLVNKGYYNGTIFHRVIPGFMVQGGDPEGTGFGGPGYAIKGEFSINGFKNNLVHERGVISMARSRVPDSAGSQFFIMVDAAPHLDGQYAAFGKVISGMDAVDKIVSVDTDYNDKPYEDQIMKTVTVDTKGVNYPEPETIAE